MTRARIACAVPALLLGMLLLGAVPAVAAGAGGVELLPTGGGTGIHLGSRGAPLVLVNTVGSPSTVRLYLAGAQPSGAGYTVTGEAPVAGLALTGVTLTLPAAGRYEATLAIVDGLDRDGSGPVAAVVVESTTGALVTRAATLVYPPSESSGQLLRLPVAMAGLLCVAVLGAHLARTARRPDRVCR